MTDNEGTFRDLVKEFPGAVILGAPLIPFGREQLYAAGSKPKETTMPDNLNTADVDGYGLIADMIRAQAQLNAGSKPKEPKGSDVPDPFPNYQDDLEAPAASTVVDPFEQPEPDPFDDPSEEAPVEPAPGEPDPEDPLALPDEPDPEDEDEPEAEYTPPPAPKTILELGASNG